MAKYQELLIGHSIVFQGKRYRGAVGAGKVREFQTAMQGRASRGLLITTGRFTSVAQKEARRNGAMRVELIEENRLCDLFRQGEVGVRSKTRIVHRHRAPRTDVSGVSATGPDSAEPDWPLRNQGVRW